MTDKTKRRGPRPSGRKAFVTFTTREDVREGLRRRAESAGLSLSTWLHRQAARLAGARP